MSEIKPFFEEFCYCQRLNIDVSEENKVFIEYFKQDKDEFLKKDNISELLKYFNPKKQDMIDETPNYRAEYLISYTSGSKRLDPSFDKYLDYIKINNAQKYSQFKEILDTVRMRVKKYTSDQLLLSIKIKNRGSKYFTERDIKKIWKNKKIEELVNIKESIKGKIITGSVCGSILFKEKIKIIGGIIPKELSLSNEIEKALGKTTMTGINLTFDESPLHLNSININYEKEEGITIDINSDFIIDDITKAGIQGSKYVLKLLEYFIEGG